MGGSSLTPSLHVFFINGKGQMESTTKYCLLSAGLAKYSICLIKILNKILNKPQEVLILFESI